MNKAGSGVATVNVTNGILGRTNQSLLIRDILGMGDIAKKLQQIK